MGTRNRWITVLVVFGALQFVGTASAHAGALHAGTPHWILLAVFLIGIGAVVLGWRGFRRAVLSRRIAAAVLGIGFVLATLGSIGLVEIQLAPAWTPSWLQYLDTISLLVGGSMGIASIVMGYKYFPERPRFAILGIELSLWILYPTLFPGGGLNNPLGYVIVLSVPVTVAYILVQERATGVAILRRSSRARLLALAAFGVFALFFSFSAGTMTLNPATTPAIAGEQFVTLYRVGAPLVYWPAIEYYFPSVPISGFVSIGSVLLIVLLGSLLALNAVQIRQTWATGEDSSARVMIGTLATTGATTCCCCAPALYAILGAAIGTAATPVYWAFLDSSSPLGGMFFAASVLLLTWSAIRASNDPACDIPDPAGT